MAPTGMISRSSMRLKLGMQRSSEQENSLWKEGSTALCSHGKLSQAVDANWMENKKRI
jgi:hypothetical protein